MITSRLVDDRWESICEICGEHVADISEWQVSNKLGWADWWMQETIAHTKSHIGNRAVVETGNSDFVKDLSLSVDLRELYRDTVSNSMRPTKDLDGFEMFRDGVLYGRGWRKDPSKPETGWLDKQFPVEGCNYRSPVAPSKHAVVIPPTVERTGPDLLGCGCGASNCWCK